MSVARRRAEFRPAAELELGRLAGLFTAAYEGYLVPFSIDERTLGFMVDAYDLDLDASRVALLDGVPVGLANVAVRGDRAWIGGIGVTPFGRRRGIGERLMRAVIDQARERGARDVQLEVIEGNGPALALYEKLGFEHVRDVDVWILDAAPAGARRRRRDGCRRGARADPLACVARTSPGSATTRRSPGCAPLEPPLRALGDDGGAAIVRPTPAARLGDPDRRGEAAARVLLRALGARAR